MNMPNSSWISLFSNNDYSRYISQGQIRVPNGFYHGPWKQIVELIRKYRVHYKQLVMFTGPVYDYDNDGLADDLAKMYGFKENSSQDNPLINLPSPPPPTHIFVMLMRCRGPSKWHSSLRSCDNTERTATLSFVLPLVEKDINCLFPIEYLFRHTTRVRDIELLTNLEWFTDSKRYSPETALRLRTHINDQLWQMETGKSHTT
uniref:Uncharacterized protein n=1 Tax=Ditylenchus dipsaci TaxID=166011 RepID=A0A915CL87_9BILA